jgi:hypothetical protein
MIEIEDMPDLALSYDEWRTRKVAAEAQVAELELARIQGTLCLTEDVTKAWETVLHACKAKFLSMPTKTAPLLANQGDVSAIQLILEDQIKEALSELANYQPAVDPINTGVSAGEPVDSDEAVDPAPTPKRSRMGRPKKTAGLTK